MGILAKGVHTFNEWTLAIERWVENPPADYLQFIEVWVQIRNIPVNHYTIPTITMLGEFVGQVVEVAFDPSKSQITEYVRVKVKFDVSKPVRRSKKINFKEGMVNILYYFERIKKRCYFCQRLTHEQEACPLKAKDVEDKRLATKQKGKRSTLPKERIIKETDPLFGVIDESQVGIDPTTGRERIAKKVIEGMRQYLLVASGEERLVRESRIKKSLSDLANDLIGQKTMLRLEPYPLVSTDIDKGKGIVFGYGSPVQASQLAPVTQSPLLLEALFPSLEQAAPLCKTMVPLPDLRAFLDKGTVSSFSIGSTTAFKAGLNEVGPSSGALLKNGKIRKRPYKSRRTKGFSATGSIQQVPSVTVADGGGKRKATDEAEVPSKVAKCSTHEVVPNEGPSNC